MKRFEQMLLIGSFIAFSWLAMQAVHELGHVLGAYATGGTVSKVVLHPLTISRTDIGRNPHPLIFVWAGPLVGAVLPVLVFLAAKLCRSPGFYLFRFFAGFCLITNGAYIAMGSFHTAMDAGDMLRHGSPQWTLLLLGALTIPAGLCLWHKIGPHFGLGSARGKVNRSAVVVSASLCAAIVVIEAVFGSRW